MSVSPRETRPLRRRGEDAGERLGFEYLGQRRKERDGRGTECETQEKIIHGRYFTLGEGAWIVSCLPTARLLDS